MGKIKQALVCWNEDNGYEPTQINGWTTRKKDVPTVKDLFKASENNRKLIEQIIRGNTMSYTNIANGWVNQNEKQKENDRLPIFTGLLDIDEIARQGDKIQIALWHRKDKNGNPCFSVKLSRKEDE